MKEIKLTYEEIEILQYVIKEKLINEDMNISASDTLAKLGLKLIAMRGQLEYPKRKYVLFSYYANDADIYRSYKILEHKEYSIEKLVDRDSLIETIAVSDDLSMLKRSLNELNRLMKCVKE